MTEPKALFVDDEVNVLTSFKRVLRNSFSFDVAESGHKAIELLRNNGPYAVVVSDMQMPKMNGLELLKICRRQWPDTVRVMLTGNADQETAVNAINGGDVFRFVSKPITAEVIKETISDSFEQYRLLSAERDILERTLASTVDVLGDILAMVKPAVFGRLPRLREFGMAICDELEVNERWQLDVAVTLSQLGCISVPDALIDKIMKGQTLADDAQQRLFESHYRTGAEMIERIPKLENVAHAVRLVAKNFDGSGEPSSIRVKGEKIPFESRVIKILMEFDSLDSRLGDYREALRIMAKESGRFDPEIFKAFVEVIALQRKKARVEVQIIALQVGMQIALDVYNKSGLLLVAAGHTVTPAILKSLQSFLATDALSSETVTVYADK